MAGFFNSSDTAWVQAEGAAPSVPPAPPVHSSYALDFLAPVNDVRWPYSQQRAPRGTEPQRSAPTLKAEPFLVLTDLKTQAQWDKVFQASSSAPEWSRRQSILTGPGESRTRLAWIDPNNVARNQPRLPLRRSVLTDPNVGQHNDNPSTVPPRWSAVRQRIVPGPPRSAPLAGPPEIIEAQLSSVPWAGLFTPIRAPRSGAAPQAAPAGSTGGELERYTVSIEPGSVLPASWIVQPVTPGPAQPLPDRGSAASTEQHDTTYAVPGANLAWGVVPGGGRRTKAAQSRAAPVPGVRTATAPPPIASASVANTGRHYVVASQVVSLAAVAAQVEAT